MNLLQSVCNKINNNWDRKFQGQDSESLYKKSLKTQPDDWEYRTKNIVYNLNSHGYRTNEFDTINWTDVGVIFGCSHIFGTGLAEQDTLAYQLSEHTGRPVINLGMPGTGIDYNYYNFLEVVKQTPHSVYFCYPSYNRCCEFTTDQSVNCYTPSNNYDNTFYKAFAKNPSHSRSVALRIQSSIRQIRPDVVEFTMAQDTHQDLGIPGCPIWDPVPKTPSLARDFEHYGSEYHSRFCLWVVHNLL